MIDAGLRRSASRFSRQVSWLVLLAITAFALTSEVSLDGVAGNAGWDFWLKAIGVWLAAWMMVDTIANDGDGNGSSRWKDLTPPILFGLTLLFLWEWVVVGFGIPTINLLAPSAIGTALVRYADTLTRDFIWTFLHEALLGWLLGSGAGFLVALVADRIPFLRRGLLPLGNVVSALPIVGIAPIMIWWFTYDWPSKTAVVIAMTFFPMLVNTVAGLASSGALERDLMRSYGASYWSTLTRLRLPAAMPFIFNGLKINSTLAMIGAIVAEYLDGPTIGMGFRINTQAALSQTDIVWAEIAVAMVAGSIFYGIIALIERAVTFWHPSYRRA
ncbi:ABC transporter permease [Labrys miyagiensis]|uniref:ABC transporter permease n=1 Tax=Labrys miyagiensis TaxID=346912 RepID=A0ABQ6CXF5_9HYPH|nr:ABC transporter permease [Labrys miyagiensis]